ncbi:MAG: adenosylcobinamide-GDP ribazoletransferase [Sulfurimonas sp.]|jgi:adenosylcobinamide-GDP ribazoletransferase|uniref:adenosylcobinamide-GDP ribazoletransferase n=1 Tax=Sulfurimonas sp. TaxID=2022749 RepID=UPI0039E443ED
MKIFKAFALAFNMLSIFPFFKVHNFFKGINGYSVMFYPLIGFLLGSLLWGAHTLLTPYIPPSHLAVFIFSLWVLITGALHLDGFSDTVDGLFVSKEKALEVMKDSHVGGMGMTFTVIFLAFKLSSVIYLSFYQLMYLLPIILMFSRLNATLAIYFYEYISSGVGKLLKEELGKKHLLFAVLYSLALASVFHGVELFILSVLVLIISARFFTLRLKGLNGDIYGFIIEVTELVLLNYLIIVHFS